MKKLYFLVFSLLLLTGYSAQSQCTFASSFGSAVINPAGAIVTISTCSFAGEYSTITGAVAGQTLNFTFSNLGTGAYITIHSGTPAGPIIASGTSPLSFANGFTGTLYAHWSLNAACGTDFSCHTSTVQCTNCSAPPGPCTNGTSFGSATISPTGSVVTISTCSFAGEYSTISGAVNGQTLRFTSSNASDNITIHSGTPAGPVLAFGTTPLVFANTFTGTIYAHWNTPGCGSESICRTTTVQCTNCTAVIPNDLCTGALPLACGGTVTGTTVGATTDNPPTCVTTLNTAPGVWYTFVGNGATNTLTMCVGTFYDCKIGVFTGTCAALVCVTGNDDFCGLQSQVTFATTLGTTYYVIVTGFGAATGAFTLTRTSTALPNDVCTGAININCGQTIAGSTACGATIDAVATCVTTLNTAPGLWYQFVGDGSSVTLSLCGSGYDTKIGVFRGTCAALICVTGNDDFCSFQSQVTFNTNAGVTYYILVTGFSTNTGNFTLTRTCAPACAGVPSPGIVTPATSTVCVGSSVTLTCAGYPNNTGLTFQWRQAPAAAGPYTVIAGATSNIYTFNAVATAYYTCTVTCTSAGGGSATTAPPVVVNVSDIIFTSAVATPSTICTSGSVTITGTVTGGLNLGNYTFTLTGPGTIGAPVYSGPNNSSVSFTVTNIPAGNQSYTLTATDPVPCSKNTTLNVTVNQTPAIILNYTYTTSNGNAIVPGTVLVPGSQGDDVSATIALPFNYTAYGVPYSSVNAITNGNLQFTTANTAFTNTCPLPTATNLGVTFMPHWDDLWTLNPGEGIYTSVSGIAPNRIFNIEWRSSYFPGTGTASFEARLYEGQQRVDFIYGTLTDAGLSASIGVQAAVAPTVFFTSYSCNTASLTPGLGISFISPPQPVICSGQTTNIPMSSTVAGSTITWTAAILTAPPGGTITGFSNCNSACGTTIAQTLINTGTGAGVVRYTITSTSPLGCPSAPSIVDVTVNKEPGITVQPTPATQTVCLGSNVTYTVGTSGTGLTYQWRRNGVNLTNNGHYFGVLTNTLFINNVVAADAGTYDVVVSGVCPPPITSTPVTLNIASAPIISTQPANFTICSLPPSPTVLLNNTTATFTVATVGSIPPPTIFQWQVSTDGGVNWSNLANSASPTASPFYSGVFTATLTVGNAPVTLNGNRYRVIITNSCNQVTISNGAATLTVNASPVVVATDLFNQRICVSDTLIPLVGTPVGGAWTGIGVSGFNFIPPATAVGTYILTYTYTNAAGCTVSDTTKAIVVDCPERLRELTDVGAVQIFPNPSNGHFNVRLRSTLYNYLGIKTYNMLGQLMVGKAVTNPATNRETLVTPVYTGLVYGRSIPVDLSHLANGTYLLVVYYDDGVRTSKKGFLIMIEK